MSGVRSSLRFLLQSNCSHFPRIGKKVKLADSAVHSFIRGGEEDSVLSMIRIRFKKNNIFELIQFLRNLIDK